MNIDGTNDLDSISIHSCFFKMIGGELSILSSNHTDKFMFLFLFLYSW